MEDAFLPQGAAASISGLPSALAQNNVGGDLGFFLPIL